MPFPRVWSTGGAAAQVVAGSVTDASVASNAAIQASKIAGTAITAADTGTVTSAMILDGTIAGGDLNATIAIPSGATATTQTLNDATTKIATTAFAYNNANARDSGWYSSPGRPTAVTGSTAMANANDYRYSRLTMAKTGTLHDVYALINTTGGNGNIGVLDDGQANATHTTRTCLAVKGSTAIPAGGSWFGFDPALAVTAGDTLVFFVTADGTTAKFASVTGGTGSSLLPTSSFFPGSGASTASQKIAGAILAANFTAAVNNTVTDANMTSAVADVLFVWRIS